MRVEGVTISDFSFEEYEWTHPMHKQFYLNPEKLERLARIEAAAWSLFAQMSIPNAMAKYHAIVATTCKYRRYWYRKGLFHAFTGLIPMIVAFDIGDALVEELSEDSDTPVFT